MKVKLGDICNINMGQSPDSSTYNKENDGLPFFQGNADFGEIHPIAKTWCSKPLKIADKNDILISVRAPIGALNIAKEKSCIGRGLAAIKADETICLQKYLKYILESKKDILVSKGTGSTFKAISKNTLAELEFTIPSLKTQHQHIEILDKLINIINLQKTQYQALDLMVKSRFIELFGDIESGQYQYATQKLGTVAKVGSSHRVFTTEFVKEGIPFYRGTEISQLSEGKIPLNPFYITEEHYKRLVLDDNKPMIGDLLMPSICDKGQVWMINTNKPFYYKDGRVLSISPNKHILNPKYLKFFMKEKTIIEYPKLGSGSTFAEFKIFILKDIEVLVPPMYLQNQFADFVQQVDKSKFTS